MRGKRAKRLRKLAADFEWNAAPAETMVSGALVHPDGSRRRLYQGSKVAYMEKRSGLFSVVVTG